MGKFIEHILMIYLQGEHSTTFNHWCEEIYAFYSKLTQYTNSANNKPFTNSDVIEVYDQEFDILSEEDFHLDSYVETCLLKMNRHEKTHFDMTQINIVEIRQIILQLLQLTCTSDWNLEQIKKLLQGYYYGGLHNTIVVMNTHQFNSKINDAIPDFIKALLGIFFLGNTTQHFSVWVEENDIVEFYEFSKDVLSMTCSEKWNTETMNELLKEYK